MAIEKSTVSRDAGIENIRQDTSSDKQEGNRGNRYEDAHRDPEQSKDYKGESQNVNDDAGRPLNEGETGHARNKAEEGIRQKKDGK